MEKWDAYNKEGELLEGELIRGQKIPDGKFHLVVEILVIHTDGSILLMQRDYKKEGYPRKYEASAGGSVLKGETSKQGALRELKEETGIKANVEFMYKRIDQSDRTIYHQYISVTNCNKDSIELQDGETIGFMWLKKDEFFNFICTNDFVDRQRERILALKSQFIEQINNAFGCFKLSVKDIDLVMKMNVDFRSGFIVKDKALSFLSDEKNWIFAAIRNNRIIGFAYGYELPRLDSKGNMLYIHEVGVIEEFQKRGIGEKLMNSLKKECYNYNMCRYFLITGHENIGANKLYKKCDGKVSEDSNGNDVVYHFHM